MDTKEKIAVMQAWLEGKNIQIAAPSNAPVKDYDRNDGEPHWMWSMNDYRIKPEPRRVWVAIHRVTGTPYATWTEPPKSEEIKKLPDCDLVPFSEAAI